MSLVAYSAAVGQGHTSDGHEPIEADRSGDVGAATERLTAAINAKLGEMILQHPGQWLWFHRRWPRELTG